MELLLIVGFGVIILVNISLFALVSFRMKSRQEEIDGRSKEGVKSDVKELLDHHREVMDKIVLDVKEQLKTSQNEIRGVSRESIAIREQLAQANKATANLQASTEGLRNLLVNNRLRGAWGEQVAEDLLVGAGFVEKVNYLKQKVIGEGRPDFTILLPNGAKLNVDAKFPFDDLVAYQEAKSDLDKKTALKNFESAVKTKIKDITSKDYISPEANTLDFVVMFIPNEMIFSFIYEKLPGMNDYANQRKVVLAGPYGFTALLRMVLQAYKNFHYEQGLQQILGQIGQFQKEYLKFGEGLEKLGRHLQQAQDTFASVENTRRKQLTRIVEKITERSQSEQMSIDEGEELQQTIGVGGKERIE